MNGPVASAQKWVLGQPARAKALFVSMNQRYTIQRLSRGWPCLSTRSFTARLGILLLVAETRLDSKSDLPRGLPGGLP
jgi:hypothetical protein